MKALFKVTVTSLALLSLILPVLGCSSGNGEENAVENETTTVQRGNLTLEITSPNYQTEVTDGTVTVTGIVTPPSAVVTVNGTEVETAEDGSFSTSVELAYGQNVIKVNATDPVSRT